MGMFTREDLMLAKSVDLKAVAASLGYTVKRIGSLYTIAEMDSIRIYPDSHWYRWSGKSSTGITGGSQIDFMMEFAGMDIGEAVSYLLDFSGYKKVSAQEQKPIAYQEKKERKPFLLPSFSDMEYISFLLIPILCIITKSFSLLTVFSKTVLKYVIMPINANNAIKKLWSAA